MPDYIISSVVSCFLCLSHTHTHLQYSKAVVRSYVERSGRLTWCRNPQGCDQVLCRGDGIDTGTCLKCHWSSCFSCHFSEVGLSACLSVSVHLSVCLSVIRLSVSVRLSSYLSVCLSVCLATCICFSVYLFSSFYLSDSYPLTDCKLPHSLPLSSPPPSFSLSLPPSLPPSLPFSFLRPTSQ